MKIRNLATATCLALALALSACSSGPGPGEEALRGYFDDLGVKSSWADCTIKAYKDAGISDDTMLTIGNGGQAPAEDQAKITDSDAGKCGSPT